MKTETFSLPFISAFNLLIQGKELVFTRTNRTKVLKVAGSTDLRVTVDDPSLCDIRTSQFEGDSLSEVQVTIPRDVTHTFKNVKLTIENPLTGQSEEMAISYFHDVVEPGTAPEQRTVVDKTSSYTWPVADILTVLILIISCVVVVKCILWNTNGDNQRYQQRPGMMRPQQMGYRTPAVGAGGRVFAGNPMSIVWGNTWIGTPADRMGRQIAGSTDVMKNIAYKSSGLK